MLATVSGIPKTSDGYGNGTENKIWNDEKLSSTKKETKHGWLIGSEEGSN